MRGGNHAIGAPSGLNVFRAAKRVVAALACFSRLVAFVISAPGTAEFALQVFDGHQHRVPARIEWPEEKTEVHVEQDNEAHCAKCELLDLIFLRLSYRHFFEAGLEQRVVLLGAGGAGVKVMLKPNRAIGMFVPLIFTIVSRSSRVLNSTFTSL